MAVIDPATMQVPRSADGNPRSIRVINNIPPASMNPSAGGLAYYPHQRSYEGSPLTSITDSIIQFRAMRTGIIVGVYLWVSQVTGVGTSYYNILKNGAGLWAGADRLAVTSASVSPSKEGLNIAVTRGDMITLGLQTVAAGHIHYGPIALLVETQ